MKKQAFCNMFIFAGIFLTFFQITGHSQLLDLRKTINKKVTNKINKNTNQAIDKQLNAIENNVKSTVEKNNKSDSTVNTPNNNNNNTSESVNDQPLTSFSKYDFVAGEKVFFYEDFSQDAIGDFPAQWYTNGSGEVITLNNYPGHWLMMRAKSNYCYMFPGELPENYTIEFDYVRQNCVLNSNFTTFCLFSVPKGKNAFDRIDFPGFIMEVCHEKSVNLSNNGVEAIEKIANRREVDALKKQCSKKVKISIWVQKQRVRIYFDEEKVFDIPKLLPKDKKINAFRIHKRSPDKQDYISNIRVAVGEPDMRNKLLSEGRLVTYGILFDSNSDKIRPESFGTIKTIADILKSNPELKIKIIGHTDADGDDSNNLELSKKRAISVKNELSNSFEVNVTNFLTDGMGETQPIASNDTPINKAQNRRVEIIKM